MAGIQLASFPSSQAAGTSCRLAPTLLACLIAGVLFAGSVSYPLRVWWPLTCMTEDEQVPCEFQPAVAILGVAVSVLVHAIAVALFSWTPLSTVVLRCPPSDVVSTGDSVSDKPTSSKSISAPTSSFNAFLYASVVLDIALYGYSLTFIEDLTDFMQALTISFNAPVLIMIPYFLAAYRDSTSHVGGLLHRIRVLVRAKGSSSSPSESLFSSESSSSTPLLYHGHSSSNSRESLESDEANAKEKGYGHDMLEHYCA